MKIINIAVLLACILSAYGAELYVISSFNNNNSANGNIQWIAGITDISVAEGLVGTDDTGLFALQTVNIDADSEPNGLKANRFANSISHVKKYTGSITIDPTGGYMEFGISLIDPASKDIVLTSLVFNALRSTDNNTKRSYTVVYSLDSGPFVDLQSKSVTNNRTTGYEVCSIDLKKQVASESIDIRVSSTGGGIQFKDFVINGDIIAAK